MGSLNRYLHQPWARYGMRIGLILCGVPVVCFSRQLCLGCESVLFYLLGGVLLVASAALLVPFLLSRIETARHGAVKRWVVQTALLSRFVLSAARDAFLVLGALLIFWGLAADRDVALVVGILELGAGLGLSAGFTLFRRQGRQSASVK